MKLETYIKQPKVDLDDYTEAEQQLLKLMAGVRGQLSTDYWGMEKAITVRLNIKNVPEVEALSDLANLSKNIVINEVLELGFRVLSENLNDEDKKKYFAKVREKHDDWLSNYRTQKDEK